LKRVRDAYMEKYLLPRSRAEEEKQAKGV